MVVRSLQWKSSESSKSTWACLSRRLARCSEKSSGIAPAAEPSTNFDSFDVEHEEAVEPIPSRVRLRDSLPPSLPDAPSDASGSFQLETRPLMNWRRLRM